MGRTVYLTDGDMTMLSSAIDERILKLQERYEESSDEKDLEWMVEYKRLQDKIEIR